MQPLVDLVQTWPTEAQVWCVVGLALVGALGVRLLLGWVTTLLVRVVHGYPPPEPKECDHDDNLTFERSDYEPLLMPPFGKVTNRVGVLFFGETPLTGGSDGQA